MSDQAPTMWFHSNRHSAPAACEHCGGAVRHEHWCITLNTETFYAYTIVMDPTALTIGDALILHSLGAAWSTAEEFSPNQRANVRMQEGARKWRTNCQGNKL
jgi:hypothetical protein